MKRGFLIGMFLFAALGLPGLATVAQEITLFGGATRDGKIHDNSYAWAIDYLQGINAHSAFSVAWVNEGHFPYHHRDGNAFQYWRRVTVLRGRLTLAAGAGPYRYFDTTGAAHGKSWSDTHGWGAIESLSARWYYGNRWFTEARMNWIQAFHSFDSWAAVVGVGYQLQAPASAGPLPKPLHQAAWTTRNEVELFAGQTIVTSFRSESSVASSFEYRRGVGRYWDASIAWLNEGDSRVVRRNGVIAELQAVRTFLGSHLVLGAGGGAYVAIDKRRPPYPGEIVNGGTLAGIVTLRVAYRIDDRFEIPATWNRIVTGYNRDTDVFLVGLGYRWG